MQRKDDEGNWNFADGGEHVMRCKCREGVSPALERLIAFLECGIIDEALALRHFKEAGSQFTEHFIDQRLPGNIRVVVIDFKTQRHRGSFATWWARRKAALQAHMRLGPH